MGQVSLENVEIFFKKQMKNKEFRRHYMIERVKVELAQKIAEMRDDNKLNQKELAARLGVTQQFVSHIERGESKNLTLDTLVRIAMSLGRNVRISFPKSRKGEAPLEVA